MREPTGTPNPAPAPAGAARRRPGRRHLPAILPALLAFGLATPASALELDWQVSLSGAVKLDSVRFGQAQDWTCTTGSQTPDAANGTCIGKAESAGFSWVPGPSETMPPPSLGFIVRPTFAIHLADSPTGIPGAPLDVACGVPARLQLPAGTRDIDWDGQSEDSFPDLSVPDGQRSRYCSYLHLRSDGGNAWTLTYSGPTTSDGVMQD